MHERAKSADKKRWQQGVEAGTTWAESAPVDRLTKVVIDLGLDQEEGTVLGERRDPLIPTMRVLADLLKELAPAKGYQADAGKYFPMGFRSGILLAWHTRHTPIIERN
jgi:hypothetical protein